MCYPSEQLYEEVAYIAYYFHWTADYVLQLEHADRRRWVEEITRINEVINSVPVEHSF